jgi:hypothetical protein
MEKHPDLAVLLNDPDPQVRSAAEAFFIDERTRE